MRIITPNPTFCLHRKIHLTSFLMRKGSATLKNTGRKCSTTVILTNLYNILLLKLFQVSQNKLNENERNANFKKLYKTLRKFIGRKALKSF